MEIIPLIKMRGKKILDHQIANIIEKSKNIDGEKPIFILDYDGIESNKPNLCTYQKLSKYYELWVDFAPKNLGDVVDSFMSGAKAAVIRKKLFKKFDIKEIKDISENKIFLNIEGKEDDIQTPVSIGEVDGYITYKTREGIEGNFKYQTDLKQIFSNLYIYEKNPDNTSYWEKHEVKGLLVDFSKYKEFK